jgi:hypothetical protein
MKKMLILLVFAPLFGFSQSQKEYEKVMGRFVSYYNAMQGDSIKAMWPYEKDMARWLDQAWSEKSLKEYYSEYGKIQSFGFLGIDKEDENPGLAVFKTKFSVAGGKTLSFTLDSSGYFGTFRFVTSSPGIDKLLKAEKKKH